MHSELARGVKAETPPLAAGSDNEGDGNAPHSVAEGVRAGAKELHGVASAARVETSTMQAMLFSNTVMTSMASMTMYIPP
jgi:hypothetical protein